MVPPNKAAPIQLPATPMTSHSFGSTGTGRLEVEMMPASAVSAVEIPSVPLHNAQSPALLMDDPLRDQPALASAEVDIGMEIDSAPNSATPLGSAAHDTGASRDMGDASSSRNRSNDRSHARGRNINLPSTPPAMAGIEGEVDIDIDMSSPVALLSDATPPPPAYSTLANSARTFHLAPLLNGVPGEVELHTSDGKRFLVHKSVLEKETVFFHIYYGFVPAWRLNLSLEESVGLPPNPHVPSVIMDAPSNGLANLPPPPPFFAHAGPSRSTTPSARRSSGSSGSGSNRDGNYSSSSSNSGNNNALGLSGLWSLPKIITNVCASATAAATGVVAGSSSSAGSAASRTSSASGSDESAPLLPRETGPSVPPKDEPSTPLASSAPRRSLAAPPPPPPCAPTPTTSPYVWTVPESASILYAFLSLIYPPATLSPSPTFGLNSIDTCTKVIRAAMGYQSNKAISLARAHLWRYLYRLEDEGEEDRFWTVQRQQRGAQPVFNQRPRDEIRDFERKRTLDRQAVRVYALASYFKFTELAVLASRSACRVPRDEWARAEISMMGRRAAARLFKLQELRKEAVCHTLHAARTENIMRAVCPCACNGKREMMQQVWAARCAQVSEAVQDAEGAMDGEIVSKMLLDPSETGAGQMEGCVGCMQEYGRCVGLVMGVLGGMPVSVAVIE